MPQPESSPNLHAASLTGVHNFRDYGGYLGSRGRLRRAHLFRSGSLARASEEDLGALGALGIEVIVDLRRPAERARDPSRVWPEAETLANDIASEAAEPWGDFVVRAKPDQSAMRAYMLEYYRAAPYETRHVDLFTRYFDALAAGRGPVLVHCSAGKDRTGLLVALTHALAGVAHDDLIEEYLLTNAPSASDPRGPQLAAGLAAVMGAPPPDWVVRAALTVEREYLETALATIKAASGSIENYLSRDLQVGAAKRAAIEAAIYE